MKKTFVLLVLALAAAGGLPAQVAPAAARNLDISATVNSRFKLEMSATTVTFTRVANPQGAPAIPQNESPIDVTVKATTYRSSILPRTFNLRIQAVGQLRDASTGETIPVSAITWTAAGAGFVGSGTLSSETAVLLGTWDTSGIHPGTISFSFRDDATYAPGTYSLNVTLNVGTN